MYGEQLEYVLKFKKNNVTYCNGHHCVNLSRRTKVQMDGRFLPEWFKRCESLGKIFMPGL